MSNEAPGFAIRVAGDGFSLVCTISKPLKNMAERERFELSVELLTLRRFSKPLLSTTQPPLRCFVWVFRDIITCTREDVRRATYEVHEQTCLIKRGTWYVVRGTWYES